MEHSASQPQRLSAPPQSLMGPVFAFEDIIHEVKNPHLYGPKGRLETVPAVQNPLLQDQKNSHGTGLEAVSQVCRNLGGPSKGGQVATTLAPAANNPGTKKKQR